MTSNGPWAEQVVPTQTPFAAGALLGYLGVRAMPGVEVVRGSVYARVATTCGHPHLVSVDLSRAERGRVVVRVPDADSRFLPVVARSAGALVDAAADTATVTSTLGGDPLLAPLVERYPGIRVPGALDGFELAVRAIVGQQVSVRGAVTLAARIASRFGPRLTEPGRLAFGFPAPSVLLNAPLEELGLPRARAGAIRTLAAEVAAERLILKPGNSAATQRLLAIKGVGPWTSAYVSLRALRNPDALPTSDLGIRQRVGTRERPASTAEVDCVAERWRPVRAYAATYLWTTFLGL